MAIPFELPLPDCVPRGSALPQSARNQTRMNRRNQQPTTPFANHSNSTRSDLNFLQQLVDELYSIYQTYYSPDPVANTNTYNDAAQSVQDLPDVIPSLSQLNLNRDELFSGFDFVTQERDLNKLCSIESCCKDKATRMSAARVGGELREIADLYHKNWKNARCKENEKIKSTLVIKLGLTIPVLILIGVTRFMQH